MRALASYVQDLYHYVGGKFILSISLMFLDGISSGTGIALLVPLISLAGVTGDDSVFVPVLDNIVHLFGAHGDSAKLMFVLLLYFILVTTEAVTARRIAVINSEIVQGYTRHLRISLYRHLLKTSWSCIAGKKKSDIANAFTNEISRIAAGTVFFLSVASQLFVAIFQLGVAFMMSVPLTLVVLLFGTIIFMFMKSAFLKSQKLGNSLRIINQEFLGQIMEQLNGVREVKIYGIEDAQLKSFEKITEQTQRNLNDFAKLQSKSSMVYKILAAAVITLLFYFSVAFFKIKPVALIIIIVIFARLWPFLISFQNSIQNILAMMPSYKYLKTLMADLHLHAETLAAGCDLSVKGMAGSIRFENVDFHYNDSEGFELKNLNFEIQPKSMTAFVGKSGAGKSTIVDLLLGLLRPAEGQILVDGSPIDEISMCRWRRHMGYVSQEPFLFNSTIRDNLLRFVPSASPEDLKRALMLADANEFVQKLPLGLDTVIGDSGVRLSGGQRQRIVLARALLSEPEILVLDEATSSLDSESEKKIQNAVDALSGKLTVIVIAHRLSTIRSAGQIIVLEQGRIAEQGTYAELSEIKNGYFSRILQAGGYGTDTPVTERSEP